MEYFEAEMQSEREEISNYFFMGFSSYLKRFYKIYKLKQEMVNGFEVTCSQEMKKPNKIRFFGGYENIVVPSLIRDCHSQIVAKYFELNPQRRSEQNLSKNVVRKYKKSINFLCFLYFS